MNKPSYSVLWFPEGWTDKTCTENYEAIVNEVFATAQEAMNWAGRRSVTGGGAIVLADKATLHQLIGKFGKLPDRFAHVVIARPIDLSWVTD